MKRFWVGKGKTYLPYVFACDRDREATALLSPIVERHFQSVGQPLDELQKLIQTETFLNAGSHKQPGNKV